jgi:predicted anti-sigma-YlaC factor YlaD
MNCTRIEELINDYVDGLLPDDERHDVERHLAGCPQCRREVEKLRAIVKRAAALPREIAPPRDLMPGIRRAVEDAGEHRTGASWMMWAAVAASVIILITVGIISINIKDPNHETAQLTPPPGAVMPASHIAATEFHAAEREYLQAAALLAEALEKQRGSLSRETAAVVDENLKVINEAIENIHQAMDAEPGNPRNGQVLTALYQQKIEMLRRVSRLSS